MRKIKGRPVARRVALVASVSLLLAACGGGSDDGGSSGGEPAPGVTDTSIKIGTHQPLTGAAAPGYSEISPGAKAYFDYVNAAGGINGRKIEYIVKDDAYNPTRTGEVTNELVLQEEVFGLLQGLGTPTHSAVIDQLNSDEVPDLFVSSGALAWDQPEKYPFSFGWQPDYEVEGKILGQYIKATFPNAKVGLFLQGDDLGADGSKGLKQFIGGQVVAEQQYTSGTRDVSTQISALKNAGADLVVGFNTPTYTALSQLASLGQGFKPNWFYSNVALDPLLVGGLLANFSQGKVTGTAALEGLYTTKYLPTVDQANDPWIQLYQKVWAAHGNGKPLTNFMVYGMSGAYTFVQALAAAGEDVTRQGIVDAIEEKGSDFEGPAFAPFDYSEESHRGITGVQIVQVKGGGINAVTGVKTTDEGNSPIEDAPTRTNTPDEDGIPNP